VAATIRAVATARADIGIILDADGDRCGLVLGARDGRPPLPVTRNRLIALLSRIVLQRYPGSVVVTDSVTSEGLARFLAAHGGVHLRAKKGYRSVIDAARRADADPALPPCHLAVETSGHAAVKENRWLDDGAYLALLVVRQAARQGGVAGLLALLEGLQEPAESVESRLAVRPPATAAAVCDRLAAALRQAAGRSVPHWSVDTVQPEGLRVRVDEGDGRSGWAMVRASLHEPIVTIVAESDRPGGVAAIHRDLLDHVFPFAHTADDLDLTPLLPTN
jgi:phosphomannomutase